MARYFSVQLKKIAWSSYNLSLRSDKMSAVNLLSELLDVRARRLEIYGYYANEIDCLISSVCNDWHFFIICFLLFYFVLFCTILF